MYGVPQKLASLPIGMSSEFVLVVAVSSAGWLPYSKADSADLLDPAVGPAQVALPWYCNLAMGRRWLFRRAVARAGDLETDRRTGELDIAGRVDCPRRDLSPTSREEGRVFAGLLGSVNSADPKLLPQLLFCNERSILRRPVDISKSRRRTLPGSS